LRREDNYKGIPVDDRLCTECNMLEDELHLVMLCNKLARERKVLLDHVTSKFPSTALLDHWSMFQWLMLNEDADVNCRLAEFVYNGLPK
jgi:hypothetical protein